MDIVPLSYSYSIDSFTAYQLGANLGTTFVRDAETRNWFLHHFFAPRPFTIFWEVEVPKLVTSLLRLGIRLVPEWCQESRVAIENYMLKRYDQAAEVVAASTSSPSSPSPRTPSKTPPGSDDQTRWDWPTIFAVAQEKYGGLGDTSFMTSYPNPLMTTADAAKLVEKQAYPHRLQIATDMYDETVAAIETSGIVLTFLHYELARHPQTQAALFQELSSLFSSPPKQNVTHAEFREHLKRNIKQLDSLPLLDAIVNETLRLYPPVGGPQPRLTPPGMITTIGGYEIPEGVRVESSAWTLHRNPRVYPSPDEWIPERWTRASPEELTEMKRWFWAFGSGARVCMGRHFAGVCMFFLFFLLSFIFSALFPPLSSSLFSFLFFFLLKARTPPPPPGEKFANQEIHRQ